MNNKEFRTVRGYQLLAQNKRLLTSAMEDYLEMIYRNSLQEGYIRINKLADLLNVKASSASKMVQKLGELGMLNYEKYGIITLTENGTEIGKYLLERHITVENFLKFLGCETDALIQTELLEHNINANTVESIKVLNEFFCRHKDVFERFSLFKKNYIKEEH